MNTQTIDFMTEKCECPSYFTKDFISFVEETKHRPAAWLPISTTWDQLWSRSAQTRKEMRKTERKGYYCKRFNPREYVQDIYEINHSKPIRQGVPMRNWYLLSVEELTEYWNKYDSELFGYSCPYHYNSWYGVFTKENKLVGFIVFARSGQFSTYNSIIGHGDYLKDGIMLFLHFYLQKLLRESDDKYLKGITGTAYYFWSSTKGIEFWKRTAGFTPYILCPIKCGYIENEEYNSDMHQAHPHP